MLSEKPARCRPRRRRIPAFRSGPLRLEAAGALGGLGRAWLTATLQVKLHAACLYYQTLLDVAAALAGRVAAERGRPLRATDVRRVLCRVSFLAEAVDASARARPPAPRSAQKR